MDSGHSGSFQSSSGNEEEYDSRIAAFNTQPQFPFAHNLQMPMPTFNSPWSIPTPEPPITTTQNIVPPQLQPVVAARVAENTNLLLQQSGTEKQASARNPKKRSRASRRAPTTVLNTDTSNFRAMVQQFTGVPSTPFHDHNNNININVNKRSRLSDLFGGTTSNGSAYSPPYILRPFAHKATPSPSPLASSSANNNSSLLSVIDSGHEARKFSSNVFDVQNPIGMNSLVFQNNPSFPMSNDQLQSGSSSSFGSYRMIPTSNDDVHYYNSPLAKMGGFNDHQFGLIGHGNDNVNGLPSLISSERKHGEKEAADQENNNNNMYQMNNRNGEQVE